jgi:nucleoside-diphosphate kinase
MISGPIMVMVLEKENAIEHYRYLMGAAQDPSPGTIRCMYGISINHNAVHGSDSPETAKTEIGFFFSSYELNELKGKTNA